MKPNKKYIITFILLFCGIEGFCQSCNSFGFRELGSSLDSLVKAFSLVDQNGYSKDVLFFKQGEIWDTLTFSSNEYTQVQDTCSIRTIQIDGKGLREVLITWSIYVTHSYGKGGFENKLTINEIWNLDTRKKVFAAQSLYYNQEVLAIGEDTDTTSSIERTLTCSYSYDFSVTDDGKIVISNLKEDYSVIYGEDTDTKKEKEACSFSKPDHKEGTYTWKDGLFVWTRLSP